MTLNNKVYDTLKWIAQYFLPALGTLYFALSGIWGLPYGEQVVGTIVAVDTFIGVLIGISAANYNGDGTLKIDTSDPMKDSYLLNVDVPLETLPNKKTIILKIDTADNR